MFLGCLDLDISIYLSIYSICGFQGTFVTDGLSVSGDGEIRTLDPLLARQVLSQLSYTPTDAGLPSFEAIPLFFCRLIKASGLKWTRTTDLTLIRRAL